MKRKSLIYSLFLKGGVLLLLFLMQFILPTYHHSSFSKIMILASYAIGYNFLLGYTGLMSLGHALFFASGMYSTGLSILYLGFTPLEGMIFGALFTLTISLIFGLFALRTSGVSFLIVTLMFGQTFYLAILYYNEFTFGQDGFSITNYLGYNVFSYKLFALTFSGTLAGISGAMHALLFSYIGTTFAEIHHSISPLLWTLLGGAGTVIGPLLGTGIMYYLIDFISGITSNYLLVVGVILVLTIIWFPLGIMGTLRKRWIKWLP